jgi:hypothetical protein
VELIVYVIVVTPRLLPKTIPVVRPTGAIAALFVLHVPGDGESLRVRVPPRQILVLPLITVGNGFTVTVVVVRHPVAVSEYVTCAYAATAGLTRTPPVTSPVASTVATTVGVLLHTPPGVASLSCVVRPEHTVVLPVIGCGNGFTTTK